MLGRITSTPRPSPGEEVTAEDSLVVRAEPLTVDTRKRRRSIWFRVECENAGVETCRVSSPGPTDGLSKGSGRWDGLGDEESTVLEPGEIRTGTACMVQQPRYWEGGFRPRIAVCVRGQSGRRFSAVVEMPEGVINQAKLR